MTFPSADILQNQVMQHLHRLPRLKQFWDYYRNPANHTHLAQEQGLPLRLRTSHDTHPARERVIENDIAWRIHTLADFMFTRPVTIRSSAPNAERATQITRFLETVFETNGSVSFFHDLALLGSVYGFVDVVVRLTAQPDPIHRTGRSREQQQAARIRLDLVEPRRTIAMLDPDDVRTLQAYAIYQRRQSANAQGAVTEHLWVWTAQEMRRYRAATRMGGQTALPGTLVARERNVLGRLPIVHIQNLPQPLRYAGLSDVEPLIPLQNELNTRLSDRANRITFQAFKMYLGRGIENFTERPVGPGQMWATDNPDASIQEFGGDGPNPSEDMHIDEIRQAMDKTSGVTPVAAGLIRDKVGNLTSENALQIVMMGLLARIQKKRITYGAGIERLCEMILHAADVHGILPNQPEERGVMLDWPSPLPQNLHQQLEAARMKVELGISREQVLAELGYETINP